MANVFVTGVAGFLGSHLAEALLVQGHSVFGCDNLLGGYADNVPEGVVWARTDACDYSTLAKLLRVSDIEVVYHLAAAPHEGLSVFAPNVVTQNTYNSTVGVVSAAVGQAKRVVFCSSMARYGCQGSMGGEFTEDMAPQPVDPYGVAKVASEMFLQTMYEAHGLEYVIAVPHNIYGPKQKYDDPFRNVIAIMANLMLQGRQPFIYGTGDQLRCFSYVDDAIAPLVKMGFKDGLNREVINIGPDKGVVTIARLARIIADVLKFDLNPTYMPPRPQEVAHATCSANKARTLLDYEARTELVEGIRGMVDWLCVRGPKPFTYHLELEINGANAPETWTRKLM